MGDSGDRTTPVRYLMVTPEGDITDHNQVLTVRDANDLVGGDIDILPEPRDVAAILIANAEGKQQGLEANWKATALIRHSLRSTDFVVGNVIIAGLPGGSGGLTSLTDEQVTEITALLNDE